MDMAAFQRGCDFLIAVGMQVRHVHEYQIIHDSLYGPHSMASVRSTS